MNNDKTFCGVDCSECPFKDGCGGCRATGGNPFGGGCMLADCCKSGGYERCAGCSGDMCSLKQQLIAEFNALGIPDMGEITGLNALKGSYINLEYTLDNGSHIKLWKDDKIYLGNQICKKGSDRCYGLTADEHNILVCEYGNNGADAEIVIYKSRKS